MNECVNSAWNGALNISVNILSSAKQALDNTVVCVTRESLEAHAWERVDPGEVPI